MIQISLLKILICFLTVSIGTNSAHISYPDNSAIDSLLMGDFKDDYGSAYTINDTLWIQHPDAKYHIIKWNKAEQYILAKNDNGNKSDAGLFTRIDYIKFADMKPWLWGFCLTSYNAASAAEAERNISADRINPKKGCNGFPFSRMKKN